MPELPVAWFISFSSGMACCTPCREARISTVTGIMNSKKWSDEFTELVGEAALEVLLSDRAVTMASIICALRERMRTERNRERSLACQAAIDTLNAFADTPGRLRWLRPDDITRSGTERYPALRPGKYRH
ncbi:hypothetical protein PUATCC27989T_01699 [Phytobacter ursingii]|nr:hypothetical protein PUATCC27989T_01699 [Phytobacter ursingii]